MPVAHLGGQAVPQRCVSRAIAAPLTGRVDRCAGGQGSGAGQERIASLQSLSIQIVSVQIDRARRAGSGRDVAVTLTHHFDPPCDIGTALHACQQEPFRDKAACLISTPCGSPISTAGSVAR